jgi:hypothetical protein
MYIDFLLRRKRTPQEPEAEPETELLDSASGERRGARFERRRRAERRTGNCQNYKGASRRETIDRREKVVARRNDYLDSLVSSTAA